MKKSIFLAILLVTTLALPAYASIDANLSYGSKGSEVTELQEYLIANNYLIGSATGNFYSLTLKAVKAFQSDHNLPSTGYVGVLTRGAINADLEANLASSTDEAIQETGTTTPFISDVPNPVTIQPVVQYNQLVNNPITGMNNINSDRLQELSNDFNRISGNLDDCMTHENYANCPSIAVNLLETVQNEINEGVSTDTKTAQAAGLQNLMTKIRNLAVGVQSTGTSVMWQNVGPNFDSVIATLITTARTLIQ